MEGREWEGLNCRLLIDEEDCIIATGRWNCTQHLYEQHTKGRIGRMVLGPLIWLENQTEGSDHRYMSLSIYTKEQSKIKPQYTLSSRFPKNIRKGGFLNQSISMGWSFVPSSCSCLGSICSNLPRIQAPYPANRCTSLCWSQNERSASYRSLTSTPVALRTLAKSTGHK